MAKRNSPAVSNTAPDHGANSSVRSTTNKKQKRRSKNNMSAKKKESNSDERIPIPVTILSGFLGSGKTTLLKHILTSKDHGLKIAVIVNDMAELNIDGETIKNTTTAITKNNNNNVVNKVRPEVVTLQNGCICCNLRGDLIREIYRLQQLGQFDYVLIESTGIAEPQQVAESFCVDPETMELAASAISANTTGKMLLDAAKLDTCVTVVDALHFPKYLSSLDRFKELFDDGLDPAASEEGDKSISQLMMEQVEFANIIVLNKVDMVSEKDLNRNRAIIQSLNPTAKVLTASYSKIDVKEILNTGLFDMRKASSSPGWLVSLQKYGVSGAPGEADEYGVGSFVYRNRTSPFHPHRLHKFLTQFFCFEYEWNDSSKTKTDEELRSLDQKYGRILRSKGNCWMAGRDGHIYEWTQSGQILALLRGQPWFCTLPPEHWGMSSEEDVKAIKRTFYKQDESGNKIPYDYGDRKTVVVLIGTNLNQDALIQALNDCCLSEDELEAHSTDLQHGSYADPFPPSVIVCDGAKSIFLTNRINQDHHLQVTTGCMLTLENLSLLIHDDEDNANKIKAVRVWLDKTNLTKRSGVLLATLRPRTYEQHSLSISILPCDRKGGEVEANRRIRIEVILGKGAASKKNIDFMEACEVHVTGRVEPSPFAREDEDDNEEELVTDDEMQEDDDEETAAESQ